MLILKNFGFWSCVFESVFYLAWRKINKYNLWIVWKWTNICVFISQNTLVPNLTKWPIQAQREHATSIQKSLKVNVWTQSEGNQLGVRGKEKKRQEDESKGRWDKTQTKGESMIFNHVEWCWTAPLKESNKEDDSYPQKDLGHNSRFRNTFVLMQSGKKQGCN